METNHIVLSVVLLSTNAYAQNLNEQRGCKSFVLDALNNNSTIKSLRELYLKVAKADAEVRAAGLPSNRSQVDRLKYRVLDELQKLADLNCSITISECQGTAKEVEKMIMCIRLEGG